MLSLKYFLMSFCSCLLNGFFRMKKKNKNINSFQLPWFSQRSCRYNKSEYFVFFPKRVLWFLSSSPPTKLFSHSQFQIKFGMSFSFFLFFFFLFFSKSGLHFQIVCKIKRRNSRGRQRSFWGTMGWGVKRDETQNKMFLFLGKNFGFLNLKKKWS